MKLDLGSWAVRLKIKKGSATPSWGTALGQGKGYVYTFPNQDQYLKAMDNCSVPHEKISCPLGKGGKQQDNYRNVRSALFQKIIVHCNSEEKELSNSKFILIEVEELASFHKGRKSIKYNPKCEYDDGNNKYTNEDCFKKIEEIFNINEQKGWFVSQIEFPKKDEIHLYIHIIEKTCFKNIGERKAEMRKELNGKDIFHYTTLDSAAKILMSASTDDFFKFRATRSDCMNDPNEAVYGRDLYFRILNENIPAYNPYIISFCKIPDDPVMWRLYQSQIQLVFSKKSIEDDISQQTNEGVKIFCGDVKYAEVNDIEKKNDFIKELGFEPERDNYPNTTCLLKPKDYSVENEWRICALETENYKQPKKKNDLNIVTGADTRYGLIKLYRIINIPTSALKEIIIYEFDENKFNLIKAQIENLLDRIGLKNINIIQTNCVSFRN